MLVNCQSYLHKQSCIKIGLVPVVVASASAVLFNHAYKCSLWGVKAKPFQYVTCQKTFFTACPSKSTFAIGVFKTTQFMNTLSHGVQEN